jgi:lipopolysaccharide biosynthesis protein
MANFTDIRLIAFYLPQFHPTPENDEWWGKGFTEWTNVTKAKPLFDGHYQPHLPADLGFYDLRLDEVRHAQIDLAKRYGVDGFCYHYYWFSGRRLLEKPVDAMLADKKSDMPFCLCWANENWTRRWNAAEQDVLLAQRYLLEDDLKFIQDIEPYFRDSRYIRLNGEPFLIVYGPQQLPRAQQTLATWREYCMQVGIGKIHLCAALTHGNADYQSYGFDSGVEFPPHNHFSEHVNESVAFNAPHRGSAMQFSSVAASFINRTYERPNVFRTVFPSWDNTARTGDRSVMMLGATPNNYEYWLSQTLKNTAAQFPNQERLVFINAWNEWAEGCHLEPDREFGHQFLEATLRAKQGESAVTELTDWQALVRKKRQLFPDLFQVFKYHAYELLSKTKLYINRFPVLRKLVLAVVKRLPG